ncbi:helix-turn-helix transcriptional regulator, partial [Streptomyces sp. UH6]|nr:helix-turn-helix transcriptional regulator [Streptomyces sp. UH6]
MRAALTRLSRGSGLPVVFGGLVESARPQIRISELSGTRTAALRSLVVSSGTGLGGRAAVLLRPCAVSDYAASR